MNHWTAAALFLGMVGLGCYCLFTAKKAVNSGFAYARSVRVDREKSPAIFWLTVFTQIAVGIFFLIAPIIGLLH